MPGWLSSLAPAVGPGCDPGVPGSSPTSGSKKKKIKEKEKEKKTPCAHTENSSMSSAEAPRSSFSKYMSSI